MKIVFTLNQVRHVVSNDHRLDFAYSLVRSYKGIQPGEHFGYDEMMNSLLGGNDFILRSDEAGEFVSIRGNRIDLVDVAHAVDVHNLFVEIQICENRIADGTGTLAQFYKATKLYRAALDRTEW